MKKDRKGFNRTKSNEETAYFYGQANALSMIINEFKEIDNYKDFTLLLAEKEKELKEFHKALSCDIFCYVEGGFFDFEKTLLLNELENVKKELELIDSKNEFNYFGTTLPQLEELNFLLEKIKSDNKPISKELLNQIASLKIEIERFLTD